MNLFDLFKETQIIYEGEVVDLREKYRVSETEAFDGVACVYYDILNHNTKEKVGSCDLRFENTGFMYYYGNIGYRIIEKYRGNSYAYEACKLLFKVAKEEFNMKELIITCCRENIASYKTLVKLNGEFIEEVEVPITHPLYASGEYSKCIFKYYL